MENNNGYFDQVSTHLKNSVGETTEGISNSFSEFGKVSKNDNLSKGTKAGAILANTANLGMQAMGLLSVGDQMIESALLPIMKAMGASGTANLPISKQLDPVIGIDIHFVTIPPSPAPIPMPHPFIGMLLRPMDFVAAAVASVIPAPPPPPEAETPDSMTNEEQNAASMNTAMQVGHMAATMVVGMIGATVKIGDFIPRVVAGTPTKAIPHFPMGAGFHPGFNFMEKNEGHAFMGSLFTLADEDPLSGGGVHLHLSCSDVGMPSIHDTRPSKNTQRDTDPRPTLYLPTSIIMPIPPAKTILTNPIPIPMNPVTALKSMFGASLGRFYKKRTKKLADKLHKKVNKKVNGGRMNKMLHKAICTVTGHPVDVATGNFFTDEEDFMSPGPIPIEWERTYYSNSHYQGPLGFGWHHAYDMAAVFDEEKGILSFRMNDGRALAMELPQKGTPYFDPKERLEAQLTPEGRYRIWNLKEQVFYYFIENAYDEVHFLSKIVDKNGFSINFEYDESACLIGFTDSAHRTYRVENNKHKQIEKIWGPHEQFPTHEICVAHYEYDSEGNLIKQTNAEGDSMHFEYENHLMTKEIWRNGLSWYFRYDGNKTGARCIHTWGDGNIYNHKLRFEQGLTHVTNSRGYDKQYFHKNGLVHKRIDPNGAIHLWKHDKNHQLISYKDPEGNQELYGYDERGNLLQSTNPDGGTHSLAYEDRDHPDLPTEIKDPIGGVWQRAYDASGNLIEATNPLGKTSEIIWKDGLATELIDSLGNKTKLTYNNQYLLKESMAPTGAKEEFTYDRLGRTTRIKNAKGALQKLKYDQLGRVVSVDDFDGNHIQLAYDEIDNLITYQDKDQKVSYRYQGMWKLKYRSDERGSTFFMYNKEEELVRIKNEKMIPYQLIRNEVGEVIQEVGFDQIPVQYERDLAGRVTKKTTFDDKITQYSYTANGQISEILYDDGKTAHFEYNNLGQLTQANNEETEVSFQRNVLGQITQESQGDHQIDYEYDEFGQKTGIQSSLGADIRFEHNQLGQLTKHQAQEWNAEFEYDRYGQEISRKLGAIVQQNQYDQIGRLTQQTTQGGNRLLRKKQYRWQVNDRLQSVMDSALGETQYRYTPTGQLKESHFPDGNTQKRTTDKVGSLMDGNLPKEDYEFGYGGQMLKKGSWRYRYNEQGFLVEKYQKQGGFFSGKENRWRYYWNTAGMLEKVKRPDKEMVYFTYDALGRRLSKTFKNTTTKWLWDGNIPLHEWKENNQGQILSNTHIAEDGIITWVFEKNDFIPAAKLQGNKKYSILVDHLGTPTSMYNEVGESIWERSLDSNGNPKTGNNGSCPFLFQGQYYDQETGLAYNRFRYYDPVEGCYISQDPIGLSSGEPNFYAYVGDSNSWVDVLGLYLHRPYIRKATRLATEQKAIDAGKVKDGRFIDANTDTVIQGGKRRKYSKAEGKYHMGHVEGHEHWREVKKAKAKGWTQKQFNDYMNNPNFFQIEDPLENMSHRHEKKRTYKK